MDISALSTPTQMILALTLLGSLLAWLVIFATLAFRSYHVEQKDWEDQPTPAGSFPAVNVQVMRPASTFVPVSVHTSIAHATPVSSHSGLALQQTDHSD
ncbi:MAG TPA: hypothetical protein VNE38_20925 [Ktedonobacteraceae bacterium]|nr:hypothetical protein [Ktedonobacteraceae bacterium]